MNKGKTNIERKLALMRRGIRAELQRLKDTPVPDEAVGLSRRLDMVETDLSVALENVEESMGIVRDNGIKWV